MSEGELVAKSTKPVTRKSLAADLRQGGLKPGSVVIVHTSLSSLGWVCGGPVALIDALQDVITDKGTLIMPTHSTDYSEPSHWQNPSVPEEWYQIIRQEMPAFRPEISPTRGMGMTAETFRKAPEVKRSDHPHYSFAAWGDKAEEIVEDHELAAGMGENSPLARIYDQGGKILLIGIGNEYNTSLHLAEHRAEIEKDTVNQGAPVICGGEKIWKEFEELDYCDEDFIRIGRDFARKNPQSFEKFSMGEGKARLYPQAKMVNYAVDWLEKNRE